MQCWLERQDGSMIRVHEVMVLGREVDCDLIFHNPRVSKKHAVIRTSAGFPELLCLGRNPTRVNGIRVEGSQRLRDGDEIQVVDIVFTVRIEGGSDQTPPVWMLELSDRSVVGILATPFSVGGDRYDNVHLPGLPPSILCFLQAQGALVLEPGATVRVAGEVVECGDMVAMNSTDLIEFQDLRFRVYMQRPGSEKTTLHSAVPPQMPVSVRLEILPNGGRLFLTFAGKSPVCLPLSEQRADLLALLLKPPADIDPGEFVPDELVLPKVWPGNQGKDRTDLNVLLYRVRSDLLRAGINPFRVLERLKGGGATRFRLAPNAVVEVL
jgi:pSer/pThr/pTyr-binding forkhead associated (FHA) protein